jgi:hypothetical protein
MAQVPSWRAGLRSLILAEKFIAKQLLNAHMQKAEKRPLLRCRKGRFSADKAVFR